MNDKKSEAGLEQFEERWKTYGYSLESALAAKEAYEEWAGEDVNWECVDQAICGTNDSGGLFPERIEAFFAAWGFASKDGAEFFWPRLCHVLREPVRREVARQGTVAELLNTWDIDDPDEMSEMAQVLRHLRHSFEAVEARDE